MRHWLRLSLPVRTRHSLGVRQQRPDAGCERWRPLPGGPTAAVRAADRRFQFHAAPQDRQEPTRRLPASTADVPRKRSQRVAEGTTETSNRSPNVCNACRREGPRTAADAARRRTRSSRRSTSAGRSASAPAIKMRPRDCAAAVQAASGVSRCRSRPVSAATWLSSATGVARRWSLTLFRVTTTTQAPPPKSSYRSFQAPMENHSIASRGCKARCTASSDANDNVLGSAAGTSPSPDSPRSSSNNAS